LIAIKYFSKSVSPVQIATVTEYRVIRSGTLVTSPVDNTTPSKGSSCCWYFEIPMLFVEPNCVPDFEFILVALTQGG
jgi:hypothetical protein